LFCAEIRKDFRLREYFRLREKFLFVVQFPLFRELFFKAFDFVQRQFIMRFCFAESGMDSSLPEPQLLHLVKILRRKSSSSGEPIFWRFRCGLLLLRFLLFFRSAFPVFQS
jgi:hypothetical protein